MWGMGLKLIIGPVLKWAAGLMTGRTWIKLILLLAVAAGGGYLLYKAYSWFEGRAVAPYVERERQLLQSIAKLEAQIDAMNAQRQREQTAARVALIEQRTEMAKTLDELRARLVDAERRAAQVRTKEVTRYVTKQADAQCPVPDGFRMLHDQSVAADTPGARIPDGPSGDVDRPSGIALSTIAGVVRDNYAECVERGEVIALWQDWYRRAKALFEKLAQQYGWQVSFPEAP